MRALETDLRIDGRVDRRSAPPVCDDLRGPITDRQSDQAILLTGNSRDRSADPEFC